MNVTCTQVQQSLRRYPHNGHIFTEISEKLSAHGYSRSADQCHTRIKRLKANYRQCQENMRSKICTWSFVLYSAQRERERVNATDLSVCSSSGTDRIDFKFYDLLEQILEKQPSTSATVVTDSIEISEDSNGESVTEAGRISNDIISVLCLK